MAARVAHKERHKKVKEALKARKKAMPPHLAKLSLGKLPTEVPLQESPELEEPKQKREPTFTEYQTPVPVIGSNSETSFSSTEEAVKLLQEPPSPLTELPITVFIEEPKDIPFSIPTFSGAKVNTTSLEDMYEAIWDDGQPVSLSKFVMPKREKEEELPLFMTYWDKGKERATEQLPDRIYDNDPEAAVHQGWTRERSPSTEAQEPRRRTAQPEELSEGQHILRLLRQGALASDKPKLLEKMPSRSSDKAPKFSGKTADLVHYLEEIHHLCKKAGCTDEYEWPKWAIWYLDNNTVNLWKRQQVDGMMDLVDLIRAQSRKIIVMEEDLREYLWQYETIVGYLNRCYKLTQEDYDGYFWEGLDPDLQKDMLKNLKFRNGLCDLDDPWPMNKIL
ncbi:hypothetical protein M404DRAFT_31633 [Pisolithus tinctorius Marx 270]|uniref:Uncharacterized protein n=1 Tax=Pisolithus tinctorius Marx 270 TaxID=870435 RepID=A0A0C3JKG1_PISTI|nr:hypothetical protein M404DRAFT_31633 [Pisolithus tinctorius Marx 270]